MRHQLYGRVRAAPPLVTNGTAPNRQAGDQPAFPMTALYSGVHMSVNWGSAQKKAARTARWAVTMTKVRIRRVLSRTHWQLVTFCGKAGGESVGVVDLLAVRKDHGKPGRSMKRGDALQIMLIQVKGGSAAMPTPDDARRLRAVAQRHRARRVLLASWKKGTAARFYRLRRGSSRWVEVTDLDEIFR
jgi:hypothetical protein